MSSFTRTIPAYKKEPELNQILSRRDHFLPLAYRPTRALPGDFIYLVYQGKIVGRARISAIDPVDSTDSSGTDRYPAWANWVVRYAGAWEKPPREIPVQGHQSVRYLETHALEHLDAEDW
jgi:hypothetical protein